MKHKNLFLIALSTLLIGFCGDFISAIIWWNRLHPWFSHGIDEGKTVYKCLILCWILSLVGIIFNAFLLSVFLFTNSIFDFILKKKIILAVLIFLVGCTSIGSIIFGIHGSTFALRNPSEKGNEEQKCAKYKWKGYLGASMWVSRHQDKYREYQIFFDKLFNNLSEGYLCRDVGVSTLFFALIQCCSIVFSIILLILSLISTFQKKEDNAILADFSEN